MKNFSWETMACATGLDVLKKCIVDTTLKKDGSGSLGLMVLDSKVGEAQAFQKTSDNAVRDWDLEADAEIAEARVLLSKTVTRAQTL